MIKFRTSAMMASSLLALSAGTAFAQDRPADPPAATASQDALSEIVVTAQKREERLQDVPIAITALTGSDLENNRVTNLEGIRDLVPNLYMEQALTGTTTPKMFLRGVGVVNQVFSFDSPIGIYFDDVYIARVTGALVDLFDVDRVEFLRGPQGTLFGRNSSVGALRVFTKKPVLDEFEGAASISYGTRHQVDANFAASAPLITDKLGFRVTFLSRNNDGFQKDQLGERWMDNNIQAIRASLLYKVNDAVDVVVRGDYMRDHSKPTQPSNFRFDTDNNLFTFERTLAARNVNKVEPWGVSATVNADWAAVNLKSITAYRALKYRNAEDNDGREAVRSFEADRQDLDEWQFSQEFVLTGDRLAGIDLKWTTGLFYLHEKNKFAWALRIFAPPTTQFFNQDSDTFAAYAQVTLPLTNRFNITGGARYTFDKKSLVATQNLADGTPNPSFHFNDSITAKKVNWSASADYKIAKDVMFYAKAGTGFRSGGFNGSARDIPSILSGSFGPETVFTAEGGAKTQWFDRRLRLNVDYFYTKYTNLQQAITQSDGTISTRNVRAKVEGIEAELTAVPVNGLELSGTLGTMKHNIFESPNKLPSTPKLQWRLGANYELPLGEKSGTVRIGGDVSHTSSFYNSANTTPAARVDAYETYNAHISYTTPDERWQFTLSGTNLGDHVFNAHTFDIGNGAIAAVQYPSTPRRWLMTVGFKY